MKATFHPGLLDLELGSESLNHLSELMRRQVMAGGRLARSCAIIGVDK